MYELCFLSNLTSAEWAAWVQALFSVIAIIAAAGIAIHQANRQHKNALDLHKTEKRTERVDIAKTLFELANNSSAVMKYVSEHLDDSPSPSVRDIRLTLGHKIGELRRVDTYLDRIPIHELPHSLVTHTMVLVSIVRQFKEKAEVTLSSYDKMNAKDFENLRRDIGEMNAGIEDTCKKFSKEVKTLENME